MYKCRICNSVSKPNSNRILHIIYKDVVYKKPISNSRSYRDSEYSSNQEGSRWNRQRNRVQLFEDAIRKDIKEEIPVCLKCKKELDEGVELKTLCRKYKPIKSSKQFNLQPVIVDTSKTIITGAHRVNAMKFAFKSKIATPKASEEHEEG